MRALLLALALVAGCSGGGSSSANGSAGFPADPYAQATSDQGQLHLAVRTSPQPPQRGVGAVQLTITDAAGMPVDGLDVSAVPFMPAMGHGSSVVPSVSAKGGGVYVLSDVDCYMPGRWELRATFSGKVTDRATVALDIP